jgi:hypothetical protein
MYTEAIKVLKMKHQYNKAKITTVILICCQTKSYNVCMYNDCLCACVCMVGSYLSACLHGAFVCSIDRACKPLCINACVSACMCMRVYVWVCVRVYACIHCDHTPGNATGTMSGLDAV